MSNIFNSIKVKNPKSSRFDLSHDVKMSMKMGEIVPVLVQECLPGDKYNISQEALFRMMPMVAPIMHKVDVNFYNFFVPNRLVWDNWEKFITGGSFNQVDEILHPPVINKFPVTPSSLPDYMGLPIMPSSNTSVSALPFAAYELIWREYFRDQNLQDPDGEFVKLSDGVQTIGRTASLIAMRRAAWEHDYFTSCLPFAQKGQPVSLPVGEQEVIVDPNYVDPRPSNPGPGMYTATNLTGSVEETIMGVSVQNPVPGTIEDAIYDPKGSLITKNTATTINDLRTAWSLQKWLEKNARAGSRYVESLLAHFGVRAQDYRLQRPEYIGGLKTTMSISEVLQTSATETVTPQGNMAGHGVTVAGGVNNYYAAKEHGFIIGVCVIRPKTAYQQGLHKMFTREDRLDYYWPDFAFLGEQEVLNQEVFFDGADGLNKETFGYIPRYSEYRFQNNRVAGQMRTTLNFWHLGRDFGVRPFLNADFIQCNPSKRIFAVIDTDEDEVVAHVFNKISAIRKMPRYGTPGGL